MRSTSARMKSSLLLPLLSLCIASATLALEPAKHIATNPVARDAGWM